MYVGMYVQFSRVVKYDLLLNTHTQHTQLLAESVLHLDLCRVLLCLPHHPYCGLGHLDEAQRYIILCKVLHNVCSLETFSSGSEILSSLGAVLAAYLSLYPLVLIFPFLLMSYKVCNS